MKKFVLATCILMLVKCFEYSVADPKPWMKICVDQYEISFFNTSKKSFSDAERSCIDHGGHLVKVDSEQIQNAIENAVPPKPEHYIGATSDNTNKNWKWQDGTRVPLRNDKTGYQKWRIGQPSNVNQKCVAIGIHSYYTWDDVKCGDKYNYVCQKASLFILETSTTNTTATCKSKFPNLQVEWMRFFNTVSNGIRVYQVISKNRNKAELHFKNGNISEAGIYTCVVFNSTCTGESNVTVYVDGRPEITNIEDATCNGGLWITWRPSIRALGFYHRISVTAGNLSVTESALPNDIKYFTTAISGLKLSTNYSVTVAVCLTSRSCDSEYVDEKTVEIKKIAKDTTLSATLKPEDDGKSCVVLWNSARSSFATFAVRIECNSEIFGKDPVSSVSLKNTTNTSIRFFPPSNQQCNVSVQAIGCSEPVTAIGSCRKSQKGPIFIQSPKIVAEMNDGTSILELQIPSENNILISCLFVIISRSPDIATIFNLGNLEQANNSKSSGVYIAAAIPFSSLFVVTTTPSSRGVHLQKSSSIFISGFKNSRVESSQFSYSNLLIATNVAFLVAVLCLSWVIYKQKTNRDGNSVEKSIQEEGGYDNVTEVPPDSLSPSNEEKTAGTANEVHYEEIQDLKTESLSPNNGRQRLSL